MQVSEDTSHFRLHSYETANLGSSFTYLCIVPTSAGTEERRFPDRFSSVREVMSHRARGNSDRALFDRLRLLSLQNLKKRGEKERSIQQECVREKEERARGTGPDKERQRYSSLCYNKTLAFFKTQKTHTVNNYYLHNTCQIKKVKSAQKKLIQRFKDTKYQVFNRTMQPVLQVRSLCILFIFIALFSS